jgi:hypothetical protein
MKLLVPACLLLACLLVGRTASEGTKEEAIKLDDAALEKAFGLKLKAIKVQQGRTEGDTLITMTLEFTKDVPARGKQLAVRGRDLASLRSLFAGKQSSGKMLLRLYFFDAEDVAFAKQPPGKIEGEVSGMKGDAFRVIQRVPSDTFQRTRKVSYREEPAKDRR